jgi:hypothetical protein
MYIHFGLDRLKHENHQLLGHSFDFKIDPVYFKRCCLKFHSLGVVSSVSKMTETARKLDRNQ